MNDLMTQPQSETGLTRAADNPIFSLLQGMIDKGMDAASMERMTDLYYRMEGETAKKHFAVAFSNLQKDLPRIAAMRTIPNNDGTTRSTFAAFEDIMRQIQPHLAEHGFSVSFDTEYDTAEGGRITAICILAHTSGHSERRKFAVRTSGPPKSSNAQADGATVTYAKRYALCNMFNLSIAHDSDARAEGDFITPEDAADLERRVKETGSDPKVFLKVAGAKSFAEIMDEKYSMLDGMLATKERAQAAKSSKALTWDDFNNEMLQLAADQGVPPSVFDKLMREIQPTPNVWRSFLDAAKSAKLDWSMRQIAG